MSLQAGKSDINSLWPLSGKMVYKRLWS